MKLQLPLRLRVPCALWELSEQGFAVCKDCLTSLPNRPPPLHAVELLSSDRWSRLLGDFNPNLHTSR